MSSRALPALGLVPGVPGIHPSTSFRACCEMDPGNKCRDDSRDVETDLSFRHSGAARAREGMSGTRPEPMHGAFDCTVAIGENCLGPGLVPFARLRLRTAPG